MGCKQKEKNQAQKFEYFQNNNPCIQYFQTIWNVKINPYAMKLKIFMKTLTAVLWLLQHITEPVPRKN